MPAASATGSATTALTGNAMETKVENAATAAVPTVTALTLPQASGDGCLIFQEPIFWNPAAFPIDLFPGPAGLAGVVVDQALVGRVNVALE